MRSEFFSSERFLSSASIISVFEETEEIVLETLFDSSGVSMGSLHPLFSIGPNSSGHLSSLSIILSPSVSGHPENSGVPTLFGQLSSLSIMPSPSVSGHPKNSGSPAASGHLSFLLIIPSPSLSLVPSPIYSPARCLKWVIPVSSLVFTNDDEISIPKLLVIAKLKPIPGSIDSEKY